jgi:hypothetical protein
MPYVIGTQFNGDVALLDLRSHWDTDFFSGHPLPPTFTPPVQLTVDLDSPGRTMATLYTVPAFVARKAFVQLLAEAGADNVDSYPVVIRNEETGETFDDYLLLNIIGLIACADLGANPGEMLGPDIRVLDAPVLKGAALGDVRIFRLAEDPLQIIVADGVAERIRAAGFTDVYLEQLQVT